MTGIEPATTKKSVVLTTELSQLKRVGFEPTTDRSGGYFLENNRNLQVKLYMK